MHMPPAAVKLAPHADAGLHGWLQALSRLGLGLDAGLMAMTRDAPPLSADKPHLPARPGTAPDSGPGAH